MLENRVFLAILTLLFTILGGHAASCGHASEPCEEWVGKVVSVQGEVQVRRAGTAVWTAAGSGDALCPGDMIRVQRLSRAAVVLRSEAVLRLDQKTTLIFPHRKEAPAGWLELLNGAMHFFSSTPQRLKVTTPFVNAAVGGTEFYAGVEGDQTRLTIFEGQVTLVNEAGTLLLSGGQTAMAMKGRAPALRVPVRPRDAVQWALYYPPLMDDRWAADPSGPAAKAFDEAIRGYRRNDPGAAFLILERVPDSFRDERFFLFRAGLLLSAGRVPEALSDIAVALTLDPDNGIALALKSIVAVVKNERDEALSLARQAADLEPQSPVPRIALSYAHQAAFDIEKALASAREAVALDPDNALAWARLAELWLSTGNLDRALEAARAAVARNAGLARTQTVLGFAHLTQVRMETAQEAFARAIALDPADPLPRLGFGLATIRRGDLARGRREIEIAMSLDPNNALIRSYLGKAYFEEKEDRYAETQFETAKDLDPMDPTPWFYDAIRKQTINRPVDALADLQKSMALNDNRAVYRSRLQLDADLASRGASLARIYDDLGFEQLGLAEASRSLRVDPGNHSAHRFLSDIYARLPRHEIARVSELLQSQLLQPININPVQPGIVASDLGFLSIGGPASASFNEYTSLFERNRWSFTGTGVLGGNDTLGDEMVLSGIYNLMSLSLGQSHSRTDGFRENHDVEQNLYNVFAQAAITPSISIQTEYRHRKTTQGDLDWNVDVSDFSPERRRRVEQDTLRFGGKLSWNPRSDLIFSVAHYDRSGKDGPEVNVYDTPFFSITTEIDQYSEEDGYQAEARYLVDSSRFDLTAGGGYYSTDSHERQTFSIYPPVAEAPDIETDLTREHHNVYAYSNVNLFESIQATLGIAYDDLEQASLTIREWSPKAGVAWDLTNFLRFRTSVFKTIKRALIADQTIEPTQVSGFNQFFDDPNGTQSWRYGIGLDFRITDALYAGGEASRRDLEVPIQNEQTIFQDQEEDLYRAYLYWTPTSSLAVSGSLYVERYLLRDEGDKNEPEKIRTVSLPITLRYFAGSGFFAELSPTYIHQSVERHPDASLADGSDGFMLVNAAIGFRLPKRSGVISLAVQNLFDEAFSFQDDNFRNSEPVRPAIVPDRVFLGRVTLTF